MKKKTLVIYLCIIVAVIGVVQLRHVFYLKHPAKAFEYYTGRSVPAGFEIKAYAASYTDNFYHKSHFFEMHHTKEALENFIKTTGFEESPDALGKRVSFGKVFNKTIPLHFVNKGYEWEKRRVDWLIVTNEGQVSYYELN